MLLLVGPPLLGDFYIANSCNVEQADISFFEVVAPDGFSIFGEIENVVDDSEDLELRKRRKAFYLRNGLKEMKVMVYLFGVKMELLGTGAPMTFEEYRNFYRDNYNQWAANHIAPAEYPKEDC